MLKRVFLKTIFLNSKHFETRQINFKDSGEWLDEDKWSNKY